MKDACCFVLVLIERITGRNALFSALQSVNLLSATYVTGTQNPKNIPIN